MTKGRYKSEETPFCAVEQEEDGQQRITTIDDAVKHELKPYFKQYPNNAELGAFLRELYK